MGYVLNIVRFLTTLLKYGPGKFICNYADKPDLSMNELINIFYNTVGKNSMINLEIPYALGLIGGYGFDVLAKITGRAYPISSVRIRKFCADTVVSTDNLQRTGFIPPYTLAEGLSRMIKSEFL